MPARPQSALSDYDTALSGLKRDELGVLYGSILKNKDLTKLWTLWVCESKEHQSGHFKKSTSAIEARKRNSHAETKLEIGFLRAVGGFLGQRAVL